ncbi:hypothetical protein FISHEDRAFT_52377 [Fistulina hepatica ATCC 64428]|nr:hypothetical protein FISHEDRAFT_52377 [Fistulina hepatica ATCC 64428]
MPAGANIIGGALFGLGVRFFQLALQKRNLFSNFPGHILSMTFWGAAGYGVYNWEVRSAELLAEKRAEIAGRRQASIKVAREIEEQALRAAGVEADA